MGFVKRDKSDPISRLIPLSVIPAPTVLLFQIVLDSDKASLLRLAKVLIKALLGKLLRVNAFYFRYYIMTGKEVIKKIHQGEQQVAMFVLENNYQFPHLPIVSVFPKQNCSKKICIYLNQLLETRILGA